MRRTDRFMYALSERHDHEYAWLPIHPGHGLGTGGPGQGLLVDTVEQRAWKAEAKTKQASGNCPGCSHEIGQKRMNNQDSMHTTDW